MLTFDELLGKEAYDRGFARGFADGFAMGKVEGKREVLLSLLARRFGTLPESVTARVGGAGSEDLERWSIRILDATSLDDVFADRRAVLRLRPGAAWRLGPSPRRPVVIIRAGVAIRAESAGRAPEVAVHGR